MKTSRIALAVVALLLMLVVEEGRAQQPAATQVRFTSDDSLAWRSTPSGPSVGKISPKTPLLVDEEPVVSGDFVRVTTEDGTVRWVESDRISVDLSAPALAPELVKAQLATTPRPRVIRVDTVLVSAPGGTKAMHKALSFVFAVTARPLATLSAVCPPAVAAMKNFRDGQNYMLMDEVRCTFPSGAEVRVPRGFVTDFASIPFYLRWLLDSNGPYGTAAVVHDFLYWDQSCGKAAADRAFRRAMEQAGVSSALSTAMYTAVTLFGGSSYRGDASEKHSGLVRVVAPPDDDVPPNIDWDRYRARLRQAKKSDAHYPAPSAAVCQL
jgi:hypothetical protein